MNEPRLSIIPGWIIADPRLKGKDLQVLCMLGRNANTRHGWCRRSQVKLAQALNCSRSTVQASITRLVEIGALERREVVSVSGRDSAHWYRVIYDSAVESSAFDAWDEDDQKEFDPNSDAESSVPPAGISAPPACPESAPPACSGPAPINASPLTPPDERRERARASESLKEDLKDLEQRHDALRIGKHGNPWPVVLRQSKKWSFDRFVELTPEERLLAEERRDAYLALCPKIKNGERKGEPDAVALGVYLRDKLFNDVQSISPQAVKRMLTADPVNVPPFGPVWAGLRMLPLLRSPENVDVPDDLRQTIQTNFEALRRTNIGRAISYLERKGIRLNGDDLIFPDDFEQEERRRRSIDGGYPEANRLHRLASDRQTDKADAWASIFSDLCEAVPVGSEMWFRWKRWHEENYKPFVPDPGTMRVVYFPKGGPEGLDTFETRAKEGRNDDAA